MRTNLKKREFIQWLKIFMSRYYDWKKRQGIPNFHNGQIPRSHWLLLEEERLIVEYCSGRLIDGYHREAYKCISTIKGTWFTEALESVDHREGFGEVSRGAARRS